MSAGKRSAVLVSSSARRSVESFEARRRRVAGAGARHENEWLTEQERAELVLLWGGHADAAGAYRSPLESLTRRALRAEPRDRPVRILVTAELERHAGRRMPLDKLLQILDDEGQATRQEVRGAIRGMIGAGLLSQTVEPVRHKAERWERDAKTLEMVVRFVDVEVPAPVVHLVGREERSFPDPVSREDRWRRQDEELRQYAQGFIPCKESSSGYQGDPTRGIEFVANDADGDVAEMVHGEDREILERVYGSSYHPPYVDVFGSREIASVVEYTMAIRDVVAELAVPGRPLPTRAFALKAILDGEPVDEVARARWKDRRKVFVERAKAQAARRITKACEAFREARSRGAGGMRKAKAAP